MIPLGNLQERGTEARARAHNANHLAKTGRRITGGAGRRAEAGRETTLTEKEVETETWTEGEGQNEVVDGFQIDIYFR